MFISIVSNYLISNLFPPGYKGGQFIETSWPFKEIATKLFPLLQTGSYGAQ
jgi:hypothetical protein